MRTNPLLFPPPVFDSLKIRMSTLRYLTKSLVKNDINIPIPSLFYTFLKSLSDSLTCCASSVSCCFFFSNCIVQLEASPPISPSSTARCHPTPRHHQCRQHIVAHFGDDHWFVLSVFLGNKKDRVWWIEVQRLEAKNLHKSKFKFTHVFRFLWRVWQFAKSWSKKLKHHSALFLSV